MPEQYYDIGELFRRSFGVAGLFTSVPFALAVVPDPVYQTLVSADDGLTKISQFGTKMLMPAKFNAGNYLRYNRNGEVETVEMKDFHLPAATLIDISRDKIVPITDQSASDGGQEEMFGFNKWRISIKGICLYDGAALEKTVEEQLDELFRWEELADKIYVTGRQFVRAKIDAITIMNFGIVEQEARPNAVPFFIDAISSTPDELTSL